VPAPMRRALGLLVHDHRLAKLDRYASGTPAEAMLYNSSYLRPSVVREAYPRMNGYALGFRTDCLNGQEGLNLDSVGRVSLLDQETFLVSILHRQDKMSMAAAIESRVPFMDYRIVEFANRLPTTHKIRNRTGKAIVKDVARSVLPAAVVDRRKSGFGVPLARWFRSDQGLGEQIMALPDRRSADVFDRAVLRRVIAEHRQGARDHSELLWTALNLATWRDVFRC
jgi:asparagine synthase (glutamine-hydrolysing)